VIHKVAEEVKVFISVDMEGVCGVARWSETNTGEEGYEYFRQLMTEEASAAVAGAFEAGATEVIVRDAHDSACNLLPKEMHQGAKLIRNWSGGPLSMMEGIDDSFHAAVFIGYHAKAHTPHAILKHTMSPKIMDLRVNGISMAEAGWNALIAGYFGVPVVMVSGDRAVCEYVNELFSPASAVAVKDAIGKASVNVHPAVAQDLIREGVRKALLQRDKCKPFVMGPEYRVEVSFSEEELAYRGSWYPGAQRVNDNTIAFGSNDFFEVLRFFHFAG
jgi:D-amino peptidase